MNKHVSIPWMYLIPWKISPILLALDLVHFGFFEPFIRCRYYWTLTVSGHIIEFSCPGFIVTPPVIVLLVTQLYPVWLIVMGVGTGIGFFLSGVIVVTWLDMMYWPLSRLTLVFYLWTLGACKGLPYWCCFDFDMNSVSSSIVCGAFCGGCRAAKPGVIKIVPPLPDLWCVFGSGSSEVILVGCRVFFNLYSGAVVCSTLGSWSGRVVCGCGTSVLKSFSSYRRASVWLFPRCGIGLDGVGWSRVYVRSDAACMTPSSGDMLGSFVWDGKSSVVSYTISDAVLGL